jgi:hypothetical protein
VVVVVEVAHHQVPEDQAAAALAGIVNFCCFQLH